MIFSLTKLFKVILYSYFKVKISFTFINNQLYISQLIIMIIVKTINYFYYEIWSINHLGHNMIA